MTSDQGQGRRRTTVLVAVATAAVVALVAVLVVTLGGGDEEPDAPDVATDPATPAPPPECPEAPAEGESAPIDELDPDAPDAVPDGATSVRLCQGVGTELPDAGTLLTDGAGRIVDAVNGLEQHAEEPEMCTMDMGPGYRMVFGYADGSTFTVSGKTYGCRTLVVGPAYRIPATEPLELFRELSR